MIKILVSFVPSEFGVVHLKKLLPIICFLLCCLLLNAVDNMKNSKSIEEQFDELQLFLQDDGSPPLSRDFSERIALPLRISTADGLEITYRVAWDFWRGFIFDRNGVFSDYYRPEDILSLKDGTIIEIEFLEQIPDEVIFYERVYKAYPQTFDAQILHEDNYFWDKYVQNLEDGESVLCCDWELLKKVRETVVELDGQKWCFTLEPLPADLPEFSEVQYLRTFELFCSWQEEVYRNQCEYGVILL